MYHELNIYIIICIFLWHLAISELYCMTFGFDHSIFIMILSYVLQTKLMLSLIVRLPDAGPGRGWQTEGRTAHNTPPAPAKYCPLYTIHDKNINSCRTILNF